MITSCYVISCYSIESRPALLVRPQRADRRAAIPEHRLPAAGRDVPLARADRLLAAEDRQGVRRPRPHHASSTRRPRSPGLIGEDRSVYNLVQELTARVKQARSEPASCCWQPQISSPVRPHSENGPWTRGCSVLFPAPTALSLRRCF